MAFVTSLKYRFLLLFGILQLGILGQGLATLSSFKIFEHDGDVLITWTISKGSTCNGITIYRSGDSVNFEQIGSIEGVCGNITKEQTYSFKDESPVKNAINCYKVELGSLNFSEILSVEVIDLEKNTYQVRPNPIRNSGTIYFDNNFSDFSELTLYNLEGKPVKQFSSHEDFFTVETDNLPEGLYLFRITNEKGTVKTQGKLVVGK